jgi:hypothetical protein
MVESTAARCAAFKQVIRDRSNMQWVYPQWNEVLCIIILAEIINTWLYVAWRDLTPHNAPPPPNPPSHSVLYEFSKLTCCGLGYLQCPDSYVFVM